MHEYAADATRATSSNAINIYIYTSAYKPYRAGGKAVKDMCEASHDAMKRIDSLMTHVESPATATCLNAIWLTVRVLHLRLDRRAGGTGTEGEGGRGDQRITIAMVITKMSLGRLREVCRG